MSGDSNRSDVITDEDQSSVVSGGPSSSSQLHHIVGASKKNRGSHNKYSMQLLAEERFCSMIWDVCVSPRTGDIFVSCCEGIFLCDTDLERKSKLDKVVLPGGIDFLQDGQIVALCRNSDTVNFFSREGVFIKAFAAGFSPMGLIVSAKDKIIISDPGEKCVHVFDTKGKELQKIPTKGKSYQFQWPLYLSEVDEQSFVVSDCHAQKVHKFMNSGRFISTYKLKTFGGNEVLRPHGLCTYNEQDLFVIDTSLDSVEVFTWDDCFVQTLLPHEEGISLKPKCMRLNKEGSLLVIGGRKGVVRVYKFIQAPKEQHQQQNNQKNLDTQHHNQVKPSPVNAAPVVKREVKYEPRDDDDDVIVLE